MGSTSDDIKQNKKYLQFGGYTKDPPGWLIDKVSKIDKTSINEEYVKKVLRIIDAEFDSDKYNVTTTKDFNKSRYISVGEVLKKRQSSCGSLATVVASVLRSLGIPTKLIHGSYITGENEVLHAWNEVLIDNKWVPFDIKGKRRSIDGNYKKALEVIDWDEMKSES